MSFLEWLHAQLIGDGYIEEDDYTEDELTEEVLLTETDVDEMDLDDYKTRFAEYCQSIGETPDFDLPEN